MRVDPGLVQPSQDFLKPQTVDFIFDCLENGHEDLLPPTPIVRSDNKGDLVAIDGHNLLAVYAFLGQELNVHVATSPEDGLPDTTEKNKQRNSDLRAKYDLCLTECSNIQQAGIKSFQDLTRDNNKLFEGRVR